MKRNLIKLTAGIAFSALTFASFAQKNNVTDAIMTYEKYNPSENGLEPSKKIITKAKDFIDIAAANPETANSSKMHYYRAQIYFSLMEIINLDTLNKLKDSSLMTEYESIVKYSLKKVLEDPEPKKNFKADALIFVTKKSDKSYEMGVEYYNVKKYEKAIDCFINADFIIKLIGNESMDAQKASIQTMNILVDSLVELKKFEQAIEITKKNVSSFPKQIDPLLTMINIYLNQNDVENTEFYLQKALILDSNNKQLYYNLGVSYSQLKKNEDAVLALNKALSIDPNYNEALSILALHYFNWAIDVRNSARNMTNQKDPKVQELETQSNELFNKAILHAEKYYEKFPTDKTILEILWKSFAKLGNTEKKESYKKILDDLNKQ
jgi:tetratricopeptide (TPR) repeat protein